MTAADTTSSSLEIGQVEPFLRAYAGALGATVSVYDASGGLAARFGEGPGDGEERAEIEIAGETAGAVGVTRAGSAAGLAELITNVLGERAAQRKELESMAGELLDKYEEVNLLYDLSSALGSVFDVPALCGIALDKALQVVSGERAYVALAEEDRVSVVAARGAEELVSASEPPGEGLSGHVISTGKELILHNEDAFPDSDRATWPAGASLSVPLLYSEGGDEHVLGAMTIAGKPPGERFTAGDAKVAAAIARQLAVAVHGTRLVDSLREAERVEREVELAGEIQRSLLPPQAPDVPGLELASLYVPATGVGGDYYDLVVDGEGRLSLVVADVAGHSIGSALLMAMARSVIRREIAEGAAPSDVLTAANDALYDDLVHASLFITVVCARYDPATGRLALANGAHNPPLIRRAGDGSVSELDADGMAVGMVGESAYAEEEVELSPGDIVLLYTDGVTEARDAAGELLGEQRLKGLVAQAGTAGELVERVRAAVEEHAGPAVQQDDVTLVALRVGEAR